MPGACLHSTASQTRRFVTGAVRAILLDIEGTTTPLDFVTKVLFPFARANLRKFLRLQGLSKEVQRDLEQLADERARDERGGLHPPLISDESAEMRLESVAAYVEWIMDLDSKSTPLKSLQGKIWEEGYRTGELNGQVFPDVPLAFDRWHRQGRDVAVFSSGSILAQKLLFAHSKAGDLTEFIRSYFDTHTGPKAERGSYERIAASLGLEPSRILFISDVTAELDAARAAGMQTALSVRPGNRPQPIPHTHRVIHSFDEVFAAES